jgi:uncharacterized membrane protein
MLVINCILLYVIKSIFWLYVYCKNMHGMSNIKSANPHSGKDAYNYKNTKQKLYKTNTAMWFNKLCISVLDLYSSVLEDSLRMARQCPNKHVGVSSLS